MTDQPTSGILIETVCFILKVYSTLVLRNRVKSDPVQILVDRWPEFRVIVCKPHCGQVTIYLCVYNIYRLLHILHVLAFHFLLQEGDRFKDMQVFANDEAALEETIRKSSVIDWTRFFCVGNSSHFLLLTVSSITIEVSSFNSYCVPFCCCLG